MEQEKQSGLNICKSIVEYICIVTVLYLMISLWVHIVEYIIYSSEVDRYCDFKEGLSKSDNNPMDYRGFHVRGGSRFL